MVRHKGPEAHEGGKQLNVQHPTLNGKNKTDGYSFTSTQNGELK